MENLKRCGSNGYHRIIIVRSNFQIKITIITGLIKSRITKKYGLLRI